MTRSNWPALLFLVTLSLGVAVPLQASGGALGSTPTWWYESNILGGDAGRRMEVIEDVNGDGFDDILVMRIRPGEIILYLGGSGGPSTTPAWVFNPADHGGTGVTTHITYDDLYLGSAGDVNGDGLADVIVGEPYHDINGGDEGKAWIFLGTPTGLAPTAVWTLDGDQSPGLFGWWVEAAGDVNGDSFDDIIIGAPFRTDTVVQQGKAWVFHGAPGGPSTTPSWEQVGDQSFGHFGRQVSTAGDLNGDGYDDVLVASPGYSNPESGEGVVFVYYGSPAGLGATATILQKNSVGAGFGTVIDGGHDVDGDGYDDVLVGAPLYTQGQANEGGAFLFRGRASGVFTAPSWSLQGNVVDLNLGHGLAFAGDVNDDGYVDVVASAPVSNNRGMARLYLGHASGVSYIASWEKEGAQPNMFFGEFASGGGDVDGDGLDDVLIGAPFYDNGYENEGAVYLYTGCTEGDGDGVCDREDNCAAVANASQTDQDTDGAGDICDCAPSDNGLWSTPSGVALSLSPGAGPTTLAWPAPSDPGGIAAPAFDTLRSTKPSDFTVAEAMCLESDESDLVAADAASPPVAGVFYYVIRSENACTGSGGLGTDSQGVARTGRSCP